jgi:hypothetical protein
MKNKSTILIFILFILFILFVLINNSIQSKKGETKEVNFIITKIEVTPTKSLILYDGDKEVELWNYDIRDYEDVKIGDLVHKDKTSEDLFILRKNELTDKFEKNIILKPIN